MQEKHPIVSDDAFLFHFPNKKLRKRESRNCCQQRVLGAPVRLAVQKGQRHLIAAMPMLLERVPRAHAVIAGAGDLEEYLRDLALEVGVADRVHVLGPRRDVPALIGDDDGILSRLGELPITLLRVSQRLLGAFPLGHVPENDLHTDRVSLSVEQRRLDDLDVNALAVRADWGLIVAPLEPRLPAAATKVGSQSRPEISPASSLRGSSIPPSCDTISTTGAIRSSFRCSVPCAIV